MTEPAEPTVRLTWRVEEDHAKVFTAAEWARFVEQLDPNNEHDLPTDLSRASIDRVNSYLTDQDWYTQDVLENLASAFTWVSGEIEIEDIVLRRPAA